MSPTRQDRFARPIAGYKVYRLTPMSAYRRRRIELERIRRGYHSSHRGVRVANAAPSTYSIPIYPIGSCPARYTDVSEYSPNREPGRRSVGRLIGRRYIQLDPNQILPTLPRSRSYWRGMMGILSIPILSIYHNHRRPNSRESYAPDNRLSV